MTNPLMSAGARRMVNIIRQSVSDMAQWALFEPNDEITRQQMETAIAGYLESIRNVHGIYDYTVVADRSNNSDKSIANGELLIDVMIRPTQAVEFISMPICIRPQGVELKEEPVEITRQTITAKSRRLNAMWTVEATQDLQTQFGLDIEAELTAILSAEIAAEIDKEITDQLIGAVYSIGDPDTVPAADNEKPVIDIGALTLKPTKQTVGTTILPTGPTTPTSLPVSPSGPIHV
jgi:hypothetical protein